MSFKTFQLNHITLYDAAKINISLTPILFTFMSAILKYEICILCITIKHLLETYLDEIRNCTVRYVERKGKKSLSRMSEVLVIYFIHILLLKRILSNIISFHKIVYKIETHYKMNELFYARQCFSLQCLNHSTFFSNFTENLFKCLVVAIFHDLCVYQTLTL